MPDPLSTSFSSSSHIGSDARESVGVSICQSFLDVEAYRWIPCGEPPSGSSSARRSTCSKTPCSPVPTRSGMDASGATTQTTLCHRNTQHSGLSPITHSSGSTCISPAHVKDSPLLYTVWFVCSTCYPCGRPQGGDRPSSPRVLGYIHIHSSPQKRPCPQPYITRLPLRQPANL